MLGDLESGTASGTGTPASGKKPSSARVDVTDADVALDVNNGRDDKFNSSPFGMPVESIVGVHRDGLTVRYVGYEAVSSSSSWWPSFLGGGSEQYTGNSTVPRNRKLQRREEIRVAPSEDVASAWEVDARRAMGRDSERDGLPLLVFVNPKSGLGRSKKIWEGDGVKVVCEDAGHKVEVVITNRSCHALDMVRDCEHLCEIYKGIVIVSGDGLIYEVLQGMMQRPDWARCVQTLPIGVIPGGSGNGLAKSVADAARLASCPLAAAFLVAKCKPEPLDVAAVDMYSNASDQADPESARPTIKRLYSFLSLEWAMLADIDVGSEYLRFLGETRFTIEALKRILLVKKYHGRITYLPCTNAHPLPRTPDHADAVVDGLYWDTRKGITPASAPDMDLLPPLDEPLPENWVKAEGTFWSMWNCNVPWMDGSTNVARDSHFADGLLQLTYLRENGPEGMDRWKWLKFLLGLDTGGHIDLPCCEMTPTRAYRLEPLPEPNGELKNGIIAIDGEDVGYAALQMQNMRGFMKIFALSVTD